jgi:hypothetical protein
MEDVATLEDERRHHRRSRMMVSERGSPSRVMGWKTGRDLGSAGVGRFDIRPDFSRCCLNSASVIP